MPGSYLAPGETRQEAELTVALERPGGFVGIFFFKVCGSQKEKKKKGPVFAANTCNLLQSLSDKTVLP